MYALLVTVWLAVRAAEVISTASSNVTMRSNVPVSATSPSDQSILIIEALPIASARFLIQTKISGCASALSLPDAAKPGDNAQPLLDAIRCSLAPVEPAALLSTGRNFGLSPSAVVVPHKLIFLSLFLRMCYISIYLI